MLPWLLYGGGNTKDHKEEWVETFPQHYKIYHRSVFLEWDTAITSILSPFLTIPYVS